VVANELFGDIIKVTPSSKVVGDMALFMTANGYNKVDIFANGDSISFPDSVIGLLKGDLGQPEGGFPKPLQKLVLKDVVPYTSRPNKHMQPIDFDKAFNDFKAKFGNEYTFLDLLSYLFYPKVFEEYAAHREQYGDVYYLPTTAFFYGLNDKEESLIELAPGKSILVKLLYITDADEHGVRGVFFKLNGQTRGIEVKDKNFKATAVSNRKVSNENEIGAPLQGKLSKVLVNIGDEIEKNTPLFAIEAMKMESTVVAPFAGKVKAILLKPGSLVAQDDVVIEL
jgi:pyruvate carboxylase